METSVAARTREPRAGEPADPWAVLEVGPDGVVRFARGGALGSLPARELEGRRAADVLPTAMASAVARALDGHASATAIDLDGDRMRLVVEPALGGALAVVHPMRDTESRADRQVELLLDQVPALVWATDTEQRVTHMLGNLPRVLEVDPQRLIGVRADRVLGAHGAQTVADAQQRVLTRGVKELVRVEVSKRCLEIAIEPLRDADSTITGCVGAAIDVTPRWLADRARDESEARLEEAQRLAHVGSFEWDVRSGRVLWSQEMYRIHGVASDAFDGTFDGVRALVHPHDRPRLDRGVRESLERREPFRSELRIVRPDGSIRTLAIRADVVTDRSGQVVRFAGSAWDETELAEARHARDRTLSLLHATLEATADGILVVDREGRMVAHNERFVALWRIPAALIATGDDDALLAYAREQLEDPESFLRGVRRLYATPDAESRDLLRFTDGRVCERLSKPQRLDGQIVGRVWTFHEVTDREKLLARAELLADASRLLTTLDVESALEGVVHLVVGRFADACAVDILARAGPRRLAFVRRDGSPEPLGESSGALCGRTVLETDEACTRLFVPLSVRGETLGALGFEKRGGEYDRADVELAEELGRRAGLAVQNARLYATARDALGAREELLAIAAHEIRGPITSLHLAVQSLREGALPEQVTARLFDIIEREDRRLSRFVEELLDVGSVSAGGLSLAREEVSLASVVHRVVADADAEIRHRASPVEVRAEDPAVGCWDRYRLEQVIENLLSNALKFGAGAPIEIRVWSEGERAMVSVTDRGIGIPLELHERIFEPFERGRVSSRHYGGLGLGLHITRSIVRALGGSVRVESEPGRGATFTICLPRGAR